MSVETYLAAATSLETAKSKAKAMAGIVVKAGHVMGSWQIAFVSNAGVGFPPEIMLRQRQDLSIDANTWPSAQAIAAVLSDYYKALGAARGAYQAIQPDQRIGLSAPTA